MYYNALPEDRWMWNRFGLLLLKMTCAGLAICNFTYRYICRTIHRKTTEWLTVLVYLIWISVFLELQCVWGGKGSSGRMCSCTWTQEEGALADGESLLVTTVAASKYELKNRIIESLQYFSFFQLLLCEEERTVQKVELSGRKLKTNLPHCFVPSESVQTDGAGYCI